MPSINDYLLLLNTPTQGDLILQEGAPPAFHGQAGFSLAMDDKPITHGLLQQELESLMAKRQKYNWIHKGDVTFIHEIPSRGRYRISCYRNFDGVGAICRLIPIEAPRLDQLDTPDLIRNITQLDSGLVLLASPVGGGLSTLVNALLEEVNHQSKRRIMLVDSHAEFLFSHKKSTIVPVAVEANGASMDILKETSAKGGFDTIVLGTGVSADSQEWSLSRAESGQLIILCVQNDNVIRTLNAFCGALRSDSLFMTRLAGALKYVAVQQLALGAEKGTKVALHEVLQVNKGVAKTIREGELEKLGQLMQTSPSMMSFDQCIQEQLKMGRISKDTAEMFATDNRAQAKRSFQ